MYKRYRNVALYELSVINNGSLPLGLFSKLNRSFSFEKYENDKYSIRCVSLSVYKCNKKLMWLVILGCRALVSSDSIVNARTILNNKSEYLILCWELLATCACGNGVGEY